MGEAAVGGHLSTGYAPQKRRRPDNSEASRRRKAVTGITDLPILAEVRHKVHV